jgi:hypothetical protein
MIAQTIQLALAPVFVLVAIGNIMNILSGRLARVVDRSRVLQAMHAGTEGPEHDLLVREIRVIDRRIHLIGRAILLLVVSGLTIGLTVGLLFVEEILKTDLQQVAAAAFLIAVGLLMSALVLFLREIRLATSTLRIPESYLELERRL